MNDEKRMAGSYEILDSYHIGDREVVFGVDINSTDHRYMCGYCSTNELFRSYDECVAGDDYLEIISLFFDRSKEQVEKTQAERSAITVPLEMITPEQCDLNDYNKRIENMVIALKPSVLREEYRTADRQILLATGGFGTHANSRGSAVFTVNLYSGKEARWERRDVLGVIKPEHIPDWAKERLTAIQAQRSATTKSTKPKDKER